MPRWVESVLVALFFAFVASGALAADDDGMAARARQFFEKRIDFKLEKDRLVVAADPGAGFDRSSIYGAARAAFPNVARLSIRVQNGSSSGSRGGGGGSVDLAFREDGGTSTFLFNIQSADGKKTVFLQQQSSGDLTIRVRDGKSSAEYTQTGGRCRLKIRAKGERMAASGPTLIAVVNENPELARRHFLDVVERWFDKMPVMKLPGAPPGKVLLYLKDDSLVVGELKTESLTLHTDYGTLKLPRAELRRIVFPASPVYGDVAGKPARAGAETVVVMTRFVPKGSLELDAFEMKTRYGDLRIDAAMVLHAVFGPPLEEAGKGE